MVLLLDVPLFALQHEHIGAESHQQWQQILWHIAAAAAAAEMPSQQKPAAASAAVLDPEDPDMEWRAAGTGPQGGHASMQSAVTGSLSELRHKAGAGRLNWGITIQRDHDGLMMPLRKVR